MVKESFAAQRMRALNMINRSLEAIDKYNLEHSDAKMLDFDKLVTEVMIEFSIKEETARTWCREAMKMHSFEHDNNLKRERILREKNGIN